MHTAQQALTTQKLVWSQTALVFAMHIAQQALITQTYLITNCIGLCHAHIWLQTALVFVMHTAQQALTTQKLVWS